jgi:hypothetical protein
LATPDEWLAIVTVPFDAHAEPAMLAVSLKFA